MGLVSSLHSWSINKYGQYTFYQNGHPNKGGTTNDTDLKCDIAKPVMRSDISKLPDPIINGTKHFIRTITGQDIVFWKYFMHFFFKKCVYTFWELCDVRQLKITLFIANKVIIIQNIFLVIRYIIIKNARRKLICFLYIVDILKWSLWYDMYTYTYLEIVTFSL